MPAAAAAGHAAADEHKGVIVFLLYFLCLGAGYILIQVALIQKFVLLLGHPDLRADGDRLLHAGGERRGQLLRARRVVAGDDARLMRVLAGIAVLVAVLALRGPAGHGRARRGRCWPRC